MRIIVVVVVAILLLLIHNVAAFWMALPSATSGCGSWTTDMFYWDNEDDNNKNSQSGVIPRGNYDKNTDQYFCTGSVDSIPLGSYCFTQNVRNSCPSGFTEGIRNQDDEDDDNQTGPTDGRTTLPKVINLPDRGSVFAWYFCCGSGSPSTSISFDPIRSQLPDNFVLYQKGGSCQVINGRPVQTGWVYFDDEDDNNGNSVNGTLPDGDFGRDTRYYYCTYGSNFLPFPPTSPQLTQKTSTSGSISWTASAGSGVYYKILTSPASTQYTRYTSTSITLGSMTALRIYTFYIYAGKDNPSGGAETYETVGTSIQFKTCNTGYTGVNCEPVCDPACDPACEYCIGPNQCSCEIGWGGSVCNNCTNGYYPSGENCLQCSNCSNHGICSDGPSGNGLCTCNTGYTTLDNSTNYCFICSHGYVMQGSTCVKCFETCETCEFNSTYCTSCKSGYTLQTHNNTCASSCGDGTYFETSGCTQCPNSCETCYGGNDNQCLSCPNGKVLESGSCLTNCSNGNYPDTNHICQGCQYPCSTCIGPENGECLTCISPLIRNGTTCISEAQCNQNGFIDSNRNCQRCDLTCLRCYGPNENQCISCSNGTYLLNGECLNNCPSGYYSNPISNTCQLCNGKCLECFGIGENECSSCIFPLLLNSTTCISTLECSNFGYKDNNFCHSCSESCSKCNGPLSTNCLECSESKYLLEEKCVGECPLDTFTSGKQCQYCNFPCLSCIGPAICSSCVEFYSLNDTTCISNDLCLLNGYIENGKCYECNKNCSTCFGPTSENCLSCSEPKYLLEGKCIDECPLKHYHDDARSCERCHSDCLECSGSGDNDCLSCDLSLYYENGKCVDQCSIGFYQNGNSHTCSSCPETCLACTSEICSSCIQDYSLYNGICSQTLNQSQNQVGLGVGLTFGLLFLILLSILVFFFIKRQKKEQEEKLTEMEMEQRDTRRDQFSSRKVMNESQRSINTPGQNTLLNTGIGIESVPAFLMLNFGLDFRIEKEIGKGGSGSLSVCRLLNEEAKDMFQTEFAVVKVLHQKSEEQEQNFLNEVSITWSLSFHPNIVQLIGYCEEPKCILTKLYERDLFSLLHDQNEKIESSRMIELYLCIAKGIERIHQIGIAHRDLKTKNILIERGKTNEQKDIRAVICDFGLAVTNRNIKTAPLGLSPQYTPPEIFNSVRLKTALDLKGYQKGDIFSFGVVVWEIIKRQIPWADSTLEEIEFSIRDGKRLEIGEIDPSLEFLKGIIQQCWLEDPQLRPLSSILQIFPK